MLSFYIDTFLEPRTQKSCYGLRLKAGLTVVIPHFQNEMVSFKLIMFRMISESFGGPLFTNSCHSHLLLVICHSSPFVLSIFYFSMAAR